MSDRSLEKPDPENILQEILKEYDRKRGLYEDFSVRTSSIIGDLLDAHEFRVHSVSYRVKDRSNLEEKLQREGKEYAALTEVTDIAGVRVITYYADEVDEIGSLIEAQFDIETKYSIDERKILDPDRFGYLSLHYVCRLSTDRVLLTENQRFKNMLCEIQIRSVLQHAWAEIEHDLGYKSDTAVPAPIRRRFSRLAGLLELADQEFENIRNTLSEYSARVGSEISRSPSEVEIDDVSLGSFVHSDPDLTDLLYQVEC